VSGIHTDSDGVQSVVGGVKRVWSRFATQDGTGTVGAGEHLANGDYSTADDFYVEAQAGEILLVARMIVSYRDAGVFDAEKYGNAITIADGEGVSLIVEQDGVEVEDLTGGIPINTNAAWRSRCYDADVWTIGTGDNYLSARWTFTKHGAPVRLLAGDKLIARLHGNFDGLVAQAFLFEGTYGNQLD